MKMKNISLLVSALGVSLCVSAHGSDFGGTARGFYDVGVQRFRDGDYTKASFDFECASFYKNDGTVSIDSIQYMKKLSLFCKSHKDSGDVFYDERKYKLAFEQFSIVSQNNQYDHQCRRMMSVCLDKSRRAFENMVMIETGHYSMGRNDGPANEQPCRVVFLDSYYIDKTEVTNAEFVVFLNVFGEESKDGKKFIFTDRNNCHIDYDAETGWYSVEEGFEEYPALGVTWYGASKYASWVKKSLPTEAQWEIAFGDADKHYDDAEESYYHGVREGNPNEYGIYGMADNGREWVEDSYSETAYSCSDDLHNPIQHEEFEYKSIRGGRTMDDDFNPKTFRDFEPADNNTCGNIGFRCVKNITHNR